jgi:hypothetical protein
MRDHRGRQFDPVHPDASLAEGEREAAGTDAKLKSGARQCQVREEAHGGINNRWLEQFWPLGLVRCR